MNAGGITLLTVEHVHARRRGDELTVVKLEGARRTRAFDMAATYADLARAHLGQDRQTFSFACKAVTAGFGAADRRLADGLLKLVLDRCVFEEETQLDAAAVRALVFGRAAAARRDATLAPFDRTGVLQGAAEALGHEVEVIESDLFGDLPSAHVLRQVLVPAPERLLQLYDLAQVQAVLLRATHVEVSITDAAPSAYRTLFRTLKFHQLLFSITPLPKGGYRLGVDGPYSMFDAVTRYGLKLAVALPAILACGHSRLVATVLWGRERRALTFRTESASTLDSEGEPPPLPEPIQALIDRWPSLQSPWHVQPSAHVLDMPGVGLCVPDLVFHHRGTGQQVFFEMLGFWSRDAVWKRVELAASGLPFNVVFGVSKHLRVREDVLGDDVPAALYVFAKLPSARQLLSRIEAVAARVPTSSATGS